MNDSEIIAEYLKNCYNDGNWLEVVDKIVKLIDIAPNATLLKDPTSALSIAIQQGSVSSTVNLDSSIDTSVNFGELFEEARKHPDMYIHSRLIYHSITTWDIFKDDKACFEIIHKVLQLGLNNELSFLDCQLCVELIRDKARTFGWNIYPTNEDLTFKERMSVYADFRQNVYAFASCNPTQKQRLGTSNELLKEFCNQMCKYCDPGLRTILASDFKDAEIMLRKLLDGILWMSPTMEELRTPKDLSKVVSMLFKLTQKGDIDVRSLGRILCLTQVHVLSNHCYMIYTAGRPLADVVSGYNTASESPGRPEVGRYIGFAEIK